MPRPRASSRQQLRAYELHRAGFGPSAIEKALYGAYGEDAVSLRTVSTWTSGFKKMGQDEKELDLPFEWHRMEEYGLPWEAGGYLLETWTWLTKFWKGVAEQLDDPEPLPPTVRQVRWWWRVHLAVPDEDNLVNIFVWAEAFVEYELLRDVLEVKMDMAGMTPYLAYKPWKSDEEGREEYRQAVGTFGRLPDTWDDVLRFDRLRQANKPTQLPLGYDVIPTNPFVPPSQTLKEWIERQSAQVAELAKLEEQRRRRPASHPPSVKGEEDEGIHEEP